MKKKKKTVFGSEYAWPPEDYRKRYGISTHENVTLEYDLAGMGSRCIAAFLDKAIRVAAYAVIALIVWFVFLRDLENIELSSPEVLMPLFMSVYLGVMLLRIVYHLVCELVSGGSSPGKRAVGIRVMRVTGEAATPFQYILRNLLRIIDVLPGGELIDGLIALFGKDYRRAGDLAAGTVVVRESKKKEKIFRKTLDELLADAEADTEKEEGTDFHVPAPADTEEVPQAAEGILPFFTYEEYRMLAAYMRDRKNYMNRFAYDMRFASLISVRRGYEKTGDFTRKEAEQILNQGLNYLNAAYAVPTEKENND